MSPDAGQRWNAQDYAQNGRFVADLAGGVVGLLQLQPGERVLDLGCGDGALSRQLIDAGAELVGVDASPELVAAARERGVDARVGDGQTLVLDQTFDAAFDAVPAAERATLIEEVQRELQTALVDAQGRVVADYVRLRFVAYKPGLTA